MSDRLITPPTAEPVSVYDLKSHARVTNSAEDAILGDYIEAARQHVEGQTGRALAVQTREFSSDAFPADGIIRLGFAPLVSVVSVKYLDRAGAEQTLAPASYLADVRSEPGSVLLAVGATWPATAAVRNSVRVTYVCGNSTAPAVLRQAVLFLAAHWYEQKLPVNVGNIINEIPHTLESLLWSNRVIG